MPARTAASNNSDAHVDCPRGGHMDHGQSDQKGWMHKADLRRRSLYES